MTNRIAARQLRVLEACDAHPPRLPKFYECGICGHCHPIEWNGDCREDANRFTNQQLDDKYGQNGWEEVPMPTWEDDAAT